jgi:hypothetical protein
LLEAPRRANGPNAIGSAIAAAHGMIERNPIEGSRRVIDFSGDSAYSWGGIPVAEARARALAAGIVINGLAILCRDCASGRPVDYDLEAAYAQFIIGGPGSFVITVDGDRRFTQAVRRKLLLEIADGRQPWFVDGGPAASGRSAECCQHRIDAKISGLRDGLTD